MTSHIFTRMGLWEESIDFNRRSATAALAHPVNGATSHHYLHALDYLVYAYMQTGDDAGATRVVADLEALDGPVLDNVVSAYAFAAVPARIALERQDWNAASGLPVGQPETLSWASYPHLEAITQFARALGSAHAGDVDAARTAVERLGELRDAAARLPDRYDWATQVEIQRLAASAWEAYASGSARGRPRDDAQRGGPRSHDPEASGHSGRGTAGVRASRRHAPGDGAGIPKPGTPTTRRSRARPTALNSLYGSGRAAELAGDIEAAHERFELLLSLQADPSVDLERVEHARAIVNGD